LDNYNKMNTFYSKMKNTKHTYHKIKLKNWLLPVTLFFSFFTFSGYAGNFQSIQQKATQIELVILNNHKSCKQLISYKKAFGLLIDNIFSISPYKNWNNILHTCNVLTKVKFDSISKQFNFLKFVDHFLQIKTIPQSSDEDIFATFIG
jgi:hypothetical protein